MSADKLTPKYGWAERYDREDQHSDVFASLPGGCQLGRRSKSSQLIDSSAYSSEHHAANEGVHGVSCRADNHTDDDEGRADQGNVATAHQVGQRADKRTNCGKREQVGQHEPNPAVSAANVSVDDWWYATKEIHWNLAAGPH